MSLRSNKGILSSSHLNSTEITPEGLLSKPKIRKIILVHTRKQPRVVVLRAVWIASIITMEFSSYRYVNVGMPFDVNSFLSSLVMPLKSFFIIIRTDFKC
jgi:hypothetical protein